MKPAGRTLAEFQPLQPGEQKLLDACRMGEVCHLEAVRPEQATADNRVRAAFVRFLALGGDEEAPVHEHGIRLWGGWLTGELDLEGAQVVADLGLFYCEFAAPPNLCGARIRGSLYLSGSRLPGLDADRLICEGGVFLQKFAAVGEVRLLGAQIGGDLACGGASLDGKEGDALAADGAVIKGSVFLNEAFTAAGEVRLLGAQIGGNLECSGARLDGKGDDALAADRTVIQGNVFLNKAFIAVGEVRLLGAQVGGDLDCSGARLDGKEGDALAADSMAVSGGFFLRDMPHPVRGVSLNHAQVGRLIDDEVAWGERLVLDGFVYDSLAGGASTDAVTRLTWLDKQHSQLSGTDGDGASFCPQPWRQLQKVLREMGHVEDARQVAIAFEHRLYHAGLVGQTPANWSWLRAGIYRLTARTLHYLFWVLIGFGYRPIRLGAWMLAVWLLCASFYWCAALQGVFAPSNPLVFQHPAYEACVPGSKEAKAELAKSAKDSPPPVRGAGNWYLCETLREEYTGFSPLAYSLDVILPLVDLQQEHDWSTLIPTPQASRWEEFWDWDLKRWTRFVIWFEILFGWVSSLLLVAVVSGLTKRRED